MTEWWNVNCKFPFKFVFFFSNIFIIFIFYDAFLSCKKSSNSLTYQILEKKKKKTSWTSLENIGYKISTVYELVMKIIICWYDHQNEYLLGVSSLVSKISVIRSEMIFVAKNWEKKKVTFRNSSFARNRSVF